MKSMGRRGNRRRATRRPGGMVRRAPAEMVDMVGRVGMAHMAQLASGSIRCLGVNRTSVLRCVSAVKGWRAKGSLVASSSTEQQRRARTEEQQQWPSD